MIRGTRLLATGWFVLALGWSGASARADIVLDFEGIVIPGETDAILFTYEEDGFSFFAFNPSDPNRFSTGFEAHGMNSIFYAGSKALSPFAPAGDPPNVVQLTRPGGTPFSLGSIDLARNFAFDPAPTVNFTGVKAGGGEVMQSFTVTKIPEGTAAFETFEFNGFTDLVELRWDQPVLARGLHQFDNIRILEATAIPEPSSVFMAAIGATLFAAVSLRNHRLRAGRGGTAGEPRSDPVD